MGFLLCNTELCMCLKVKFNWCQICAATARATVLCMEISLDKNRESLKHLILKADWYGSLGMWYNNFFFQAIALNSAPVICDWDVFACSGSLTYLRLIGGFHPSLLMWLFISNCPISSWSQRIIVVLTWLFLVPLFYRHIIVANWHQTRGTSGLQLVRSSWGLLLWGNGQGGERSHLCRWDVTLAPGFL